MKLKALSSLPALLVTGTSKLRLSAEEIQAVVSNSLPLRFDNGMITAVEVSFVPEKDLIQIELRGSFSGLVNAIPYRCGFGFATVGTVYYNQDKSSLYFKPVSFGAVSIAPGEGMVVVEPVINLATNAVGAVYGGASSGIRSVGDLVGKGLAAVRNRLVPSVLRRAGSYVSDTIGTSVSKVTGKVGEGFGAVQAMIEGVVVSAAALFLEQTPIYTFQNDELSQHAKNLVREVKIEQGGLVVILSVERHQTLQLWRKIGASSLIGLMIAGGAYLLY